MSESENEQKIHKEFLSYKRKLISKFGNKALYNDEIESIGSQLFGPKWQGCHSHTNMTFKPGFQIVNTGNEKSSGIHWVAVYISPSTIYIYDSFGRDVDLILKSIRAKAKKKKIKIVESDRDAEQRGRSEVCGHLSISWLCVVKNRGISKALLI